MSLFSRTSCCLSIFLKFHIDLFSGDWEKKSLTTNIIFFEQSQVYCVKIWIDFSLLSEREVIKLSWNPHRFQRKDRYRMSLREWLVFNNYSLQLPQPTLQSLAGVYDLPCPIFLLHYSCLVIMIKCLTNLTLFHKQTAWFSEDRHGASFQLWPGSLTCWSKTPIGGIVQGCCDRAAKLPKLGQPA